MFRTAQTRTTKVLMKSQVNFVKAILIVCITMLLLTVIGVSAYTYNLLNANTFYPGIYIDGVIIESLTPSEAFRALQSTHQLKLDAIRIILKHEDKAWEYGYRVINARINTHEMIDKAYQVGRTGNIINRLSDIYEANRNGVNFETTLTVDPDLLITELVGIAQEIHVEPVDATITFHNKEEVQFTFTEESNGKSLNVEKTMIDIKEKIEKLNFTPYQISVDTLYPNYCLEEVKTWTSKLVTRHTVISGADERVHNIVLSSSFFDGIRINPEEIFSLNEATGPRGLKEGYKDAPVIIGGVRLKDEPGGGNCQTSTTLYGAAVLADMEIVERWRHSFPISYTEVGQDAMVDYPTYDLKFKNNKETPVFISRIIEGNKIIIEIYGKSTDEYDYISIETEILSISDKPDEEIVRDPDLYDDQIVLEYVSRPGIKAQSYRVYYRNGVEIKRVKEAYSNYRQIVGRKRVGTKPRP